MSGPRHGTRSTTGLAALIALAAVVPLLAQDGITPKTLYLVLRTGPNETETEIQSKLRRGIDHVGAIIDGDPRIRPVSGAFVEELEALADRAGAVAAGEEKDGISLRYLPSRDSAYEIKIPPTQVLRKLKVTYQKAGEKEYVPASPGEKGPLFLSVSGRYAFTPEPGDIPLKYEGEVSEFGKPDSNFQREWPKSDKFFVVTMKNFRGNKDALFRAIQDKDVVPNPFKLYDEKADLMFAFASLNSTVGRPGRSAINERNELLLSVETLPNESPKRAWVYLPLDEESAQKALEEYRKFNTLELPQEIRKSAVRFPFQAALGVQDTPKWHEVPMKFPPRPTEFERVVKLNGLRELGLKYPKMYMLVVWEFDSERPGSKPEAILVEDKAEKSGRVTVMKRELADWGQGVQDALKRTPEPVPEKK